MSLKKYLKGIEEMESWYTFSKETEEILKIMPLVRNGKLLLMGPYGYGKSLYAYLVGRIFFNYRADNMPVAQLMDELSVYDVLFNIDIPSLMKGEEKMEPREIVSAPFKFINEFQRGNYRVYNALLGLFSEGFITIRDMKFETQDYFAVLDANPMDSGSREIPAALLDRITASVNMRSLKGEEMMQMLDYDVELNKVKNYLSPRDMAALWKKVNGVKVPDSAKLLLALVHSYFSSCIYGDRAVMDSRHVASLCESCTYRTEPCAMLKEPLGQRWWKDTLRIAKAKAFFESRDSVKIDDIFFAMPYALQHRVRTREKLRSLYPSKEKWVKESVENARRLLKGVWIPALKGDEKKREKDRRTLSAIGVEQ